MSFVDAADEGGVELAPSDSVQAGAGGGAGQPDVDTLGRELRDHGLQPLAQAGAGAQA